MVTHLYALAIATNMEYEADSPLSYDVEEGELGSGRSNPGTIRENASDCSTQTDDNTEPMTTMRVEVDNSTSSQQSKSISKQPTPLEIARIMAERSVRPRNSDVRKNLYSFRTRKSNQLIQTTELQDKATPSYQNGRPVKHKSHKNVTNASPPMSIHPTPVRPPPPIEDFTYDHHRIQQRVQQRWFERNSADIRPNKLRFPYAVTQRSNNRKSFFHQSTHEQSPTQTISETIWFAELDPRTLTNPHNSEYNPLLSYRKWAEMQLESKMYNFVIAPIHNLKDRVSEFFPPLSSENTSTVHGKR